MKASTPQHLLCALAAALALASCSKPTAPPPIQRVILISCDTLRADHLGVYGYARPTSPAVDAFAREGVVFENAYSSSPWTGPSLSSLMTGRLPDEIGVPGGNRFPLPPAAVTLAEVIRDAGVPTAAVVSNWVLRRPDASHGDAGVAQGFQSFDDRMTSREQNREANFERIAPDTTRAAIEWLEKQKRAGSERFFLWVHYQDPHGPYTPPPELAREFAREPSAEPDLRVHTTHSGKGQIPAYQAIEGEHNPELYRARYDAEIRGFDRSFGELLDWLRAADWYDSALIVFTADHGESLGEHNYWFCHGETVQRELVRVPLIIRYPDGAHRPPWSANAGRVEALASHLDLWPTVLEAFGLPQRENRGTSLFAELPRERVCVQTLGRRGSAIRWEAVTSEQFRCVIERDLPARLYDVRADPGELHDLAGTEPERLQRLLARGQAFVREATGPSLPARELSLDDDGRRAMQALGYVDGD